MSDLAINEKMIVTNVDDVLHKMSQYLGSVIELEEITEYIENSRNVYYYMDRYLGSNILEQSNSVYVWIDTGLKKNQKPVFISLLRRDDGYEGYFYGDADRLAKSVINYFPSYRRIILNNILRFKEKYKKKHVSEEALVSNEERGTITNLERVNEINKENTYRAESNIYDEINDNLLINNWQSPKGLERYIKIIGCRIGQLVDQRREEYYIINKIKSVVVNTGLLDKFANDIHIMYKWNVKYNSYCPEKVIRCKSELKEEGFERGQIQKNIKAVSFFDEEETLKGISIDDFDLNSDCLKHIVDERRDRFPEELENYSVDSLAIKIKETLSRDLKILEHDCHYAKPSYSSKTKSITWLMPFHVQRGLVEKPELVFAVRHNNESGYYELKTILIYDETIMDKITSLSLYAESW